MEAAPDSFKAEMMACGAGLRAFAISLSGNGDRALDLVQETYLRALANWKSFVPGSNMQAWLYTILRNLFRSDYRKRRREVEDAEGNYAKTLKTQPNQSAHLDFEDFRKALEKIPQDQREALILVGASGFSYDDAAAICNCAVGTIKSRVNRARLKLHELLDTFELRELNKKSWQDSDDPPQATFTEKKPDYKKKHRGIWKETEKSKRVSDFFHPPVEASPVKRFTKKELQEASIPVMRTDRKATPTPKPVKKAPSKPGIVFDGAAYELVGTAKLPNGQTQAVYKAA